MPEAISWVVYGTLAVVATMFWRRRRTVPSAWLAATFVVLGGVVLQGALVSPPADPPAQFSPWEVYTDVIVVGLLGFPYLLHRFVRSLRPTRRLSGTLADVGMAGIVVLTFAMPAFPADGDFTPAQQIAQVVMLSWWAVLLASVSWVLWRAGRGRPGIIRSRMRLMSVAALLINLGLLGSVLGDAEGQNAAYIITQVLGWASAGAFLLAFEPPLFVRRSWRAKEETALRVAESRLVAATSATEAANAIVDAAAALVGGHAAEVRDADGAVLARSTSERDDDPVDDRLEVRLSRSTVVVHRSRLTPVFSEGEEVLLRQLCGHLDLALDRISAFEASELALREAERANTELSQLVYGVSHDLRNPLVTVLGFLDFITDDETPLSDTQIMALERITISARYMEGLIDDLLQLSRVGRTDNDPKPIAIAPLVEDIRTDLVPRFPDLDISVAGDADVLINEVRARQLFINLLENAARHGGRSPLHVTVTCVLIDDGMATIEVADDGVGIPDEHRDRVFQIFQRLDRFDARTKGSGIGLTMCRKITEDVGGGIVIADSTSGTTFRITLPAVPPGQPSPGPLASSQERKP